MEMRPIQSIKVSARARKNMGDMEALAASIREVGLLHPVVVRPDGTLVAGFRRVQAFRRLGLAEIPVRVIENFDDAVTALMAERDENSCRQDLSPSEAVIVGRRLEQLERPAAKKRQADAGPQKGRGAKPTASGKKPEAVTGQTRDRVGAAVGMSGRTYEKAKQVAEAAETEPEQFGDLVEEMDRTGIVEAPYQELRARKSGPLMIPKRGGRQRPEQPYAAMLKLLGRIEAKLKEPNITVAAIHQFVMKLREELTNPNVQPKR